MRAHIFKQPDLSSRRDHASDLVKRRHLQLVGENTEQECGDCSVERGDREIQCGYIHLMKATGSRQCRTSGVGTSEHRRTRVDTRNNCGWRVELAVATRPYARVQQSTVHAIKNQSLYRAISASFESQVPDRSLSRHSIAGSSPRFQLCAMTCRITAPHNLIGWLIGITELSALARQKRYQKQNRHA